MWNHLKSKGGGVSIFVNCQIFSRSVKNAVPLIFFYLKLKNNKFRYLLRLKIVNKGKYWNLQKLSNQEWINDHYDLISIFSVRVIYNLKTLFND